VLKILIMSDNNKKSDNFSKKIYFDHLLDLTPSSVYWKDLNGDYLGCNQTMLKMVGLSSVSEIIGKTDYDLPWKLSADMLRENDKRVIESGKLEHFEETGILTDGSVVTVISNKMPLFDISGKIIGTIGASIDITHLKKIETALLLAKEQSIKAAQLKLENEIQRKSLEDQKEFTKVANQVAHDIRSPLASLLMIIKSCTEIPEAERIALREAAINIGDITNNLLSRYIKKEPDLSGESEKSQPMLVSATLLQLLADKKYEYQNLSIKLDHDISQAGHFAFIKISISDFKRMISNLINNAKDAFDLSENKQAKIIISLDASNEWVTISIQDNGKGMSRDLIEKIKQNIAVTEGKKEGYGIGLTQVRETLQRYQGEFSIASELGRGTKVTLTFPRIKAPSWIGEEIKLRNQNTIVILDDDTSIHTAWDTRFEPILKSSPDIKIKHFHQGKEALDFLNSLSTQEKEEIFLLTDFELLKQELNGLSVIEKSKIKHSLLVTSHYMNPDLRIAASKTGTKILPKQLASEIQIKIDKKIKYENIDELIDLIIVDDDERFTDDLIYFVFRNKKIACYNDPHHFLANVAKFPKSTKILLDNNFATGDVLGTELAKILHAQGYIHLYLLSGDAFEQRDLPSYLTAIRKDDLASLTKKIT
jgi:PAS domain S-box-containing protein